MRKGERCHCTAPLFQSVTICNRYNLYALPIRFSQDNALPVNKIPTSVGADVGNGWALLN